MDIKKITKEVPMVTNIAEWLQKQTGKKLTFGQNSLLDLVDDISPTEDTPVDVLLAIVGKALIKVATIREWHAYAWLCKHLNCEKIRETIETEMAPIRR